MRREKAATVLSVQTKQVRNASAPRYQLQFGFHYGELLEIPIIVQERYALSQGEVHAAS
jgi:hypothetical protein